MPLCRSKSRGLVSTHGPAPEGRTIMKMNSHSRTKQGLSQDPGAGADSPAPGADGQVLAQRLGALSLPAPSRAGRGPANCPRLYTALYTTSEKVPRSRHAAAVRKAVR
jgi:hypothetical protein